MAPNYGGYVSPDTNFHGVVLDGFNNTLGGTNPGYRNLISGNVAHGVLICCVESSDNDVLGNYIGTRRERK